MFRTSAKFSMLASRVLQARRLAAGPHHAPANDNRPARVRPRPLVCRWTLADCGTRLICHWEEEADAPEPKPAISLGLRGVLSSPSCHIRRLPDRVSQEVLPRRRVRTTTTRI